MEDYLKLVDSFYKFKNDYEKKYKETLRKINKKDISLKEKRKLVSSIQRKCIQCKKSGGTLFEVNNTHYNAICSAKDEQCSLNLMIPRVAYFNLNDVIMDDLHKDLLTIEANIIELKLKQIFGYITSEDLVESFEEESEKYKETNTVLESLQAKLSEIYDHKDIASKQIELQNIHNELNKVYNSYIDTGEDKYIDDVVEQNIMLMHTERALNDATYLDRRVEIEVKDDDSTILTYKRGGDLIPQHEMQY